MKQKILRNRALLSDLLSLFLLNFNEAGIQAVNFGLSYNYGKPFSLTDEK